MAKSTVTLISCGVGDDASLGYALESIGSRVLPAEGPESVINAERIIMSGEGSFPQAMAKLNQSGISDALVRAITSGTPILGINLGMQLLFSACGAEGKYMGLAVFGDRLVPVPGKRSRHIGWNTVRDYSGCPLLKGLDRHYFYFRHELCAADIRAVHTAGVTDHEGFDFVSAAGRDSVFGVQFLPEKSGEDGVMLLRNFTEIASK